MPGFCWSVLIPLRTFSRISGRARARDAIELVERVRARLAALRTIERKPEE
jgi:hypothetical protein